MDVAALLPHRHDEAGEDDGPLVVLPPTRWERRRALGSRVLEAGAAALSPDRGGPFNLPLPLPRPRRRRGGLVAPRAVLPSKLLTSRRSVWSVASMWSAGSLYSAFSAGSVMSLGSCGSILSIGSVGSVLSIGSAGSVLSIGSMGSIGAIGGMGQRPAGATGDADAPAADPMATLAVGARVLAVAALVSAATHR